MVSTLVTIWIAWLVLCPLNIVFFLIWRRGKENVVEGGKLSGGGLQMAEWKMIALFSGIGLAGIFVGLLQVMGIIRVPLG